LHSQTQIPLGEWACIEWEASQGAGSGDVRVWLNGAELTDAALTNVPVVNVDVFGFGVYPDTVPSSGFDLRYDEIAIDNKPIGCDK
jgi:hypothetical protein